MITEKNHQNKSRKFVLFKIHKKIKNLLSNSNKIYFQYDLVRYRSKAQNITNIVWYTLSIEYTNFFNINFCYRISFYFSEIVIFIKYILDNSKELHYHIFLQQDRPINLKLGIHNWVLTNIFVSLTTNIPIFFGLK